MYAAISSIVTRARTATYRGRKAAIEQGNHHAQVVHVTGGGGCGGRRRPLASPQGARVAQNRRAAATDGGGARVIQLLGCGTCRSVHIATLPGGRPVLDLVLRLHGVDKCEGGKERGGKRSGERKGEEEEEEE